MKGPKTRTMSYVSHNSAKSMMRCICTAGRLFYDAAGHMTACCVVVLRLIDDDLV